MLIKFPRHNLHVIHKLIPPETKTEKRSLSVSTSPNISEPKCLVCFSKIKKGHKEEKKDRIPAIQHAGQSKRTIHLCLLKQFLVFLNIINTPRSDTVAQMEGI